MTGGLRELPQVNVPELPRMADFAQWGEAVGRGLGWVPGSFLERYRSNRKQATIPALAQSAVAGALCDVGEALELDEWQNQPPTMLFRELTNYVERRNDEIAVFLPPADVRRSRAALAAHWPKDPQAFSKELRRIAPQLRLHGISIEFERDSKGRRVVFKVAEPPPGPREDKP